MIRNGRSTIVWLAVTAMVSLITPPAASQQQPRRGGQISIALYQEPELLNPYIATQTVSFEVLSPVVDGLLKNTPKGEYYPQLAAEVPTQANGGVSADGKTITYHLRPGLTWSDGRALSCDDITFTWQAIMTPKSGAVETTGFD